MATFSEYMHKTVDEVLTMLGTSDAGLTLPEAQRRLATYGPNVLKIKKLRWWSILIRQFKSSFVYLLLVAALFAFIVGEYIDGMLILLALVFNVVFSFYQEYRSERAAELLQHYLKAYITVKREGDEQVIDAQLLVPGDVIKILPGTSIPADIRFIEAQNVAVDESALTGESTPLTKTSTPLAASSELYQAHNIGFAGTRIVSGRGMGVIFATGRQTMLGEITRFAEPLEQETVLEKQLKQLGNFILIFVALSLVVVFLASFFKGLRQGSLDLISLINFCIALAVSVIPEALPVVTTFSLSQGALRLSRRKVVVKRLQIIQDLGAVDVLCSDKTGTLTENQLVVEDVYAHRDACQVYFYAFLGRETLDVQEFAPIENPFDKALWNAINPEERSLIHDYKRIYEIPFTSVRGMNSVLIEIDDSFQLITRGMPEKIVAQAPNVSPEEQEKIAAWIRDKGRKGVRVIAVARKNIASLKDKNILEHVEHLEHDLPLLGLISFVDPIKETTFPAVKKAKSLGVMVKILTGDSREVAQYLIEHIGLSEPGKPAVMLGSEFEQLSDQEKKKAVEQFPAFARTTPQQKYLIVRLLQEKYEVGYVGDGINDVPPLNAAHVGIAIQTAVDVAREAADIILLEKDLKVIVDGISEGRKIFNNITKYILATLSANFGNFFALVAASFLVVFLPLSPTQILLVNILSDIPLIFLATDTVSAADIKKPSVYAMKKIGILILVLGITSTLFDLIFFLLFRRDEATLQTNWFMASIFTELAFAFSIRTRLPFFKAPQPSRALLLVSGLVGVITLLLPYTFFGHYFFGFTEQPLSRVGLILSIVVIYFLITDRVKLWLYAMLY